jgi:hypothetical protein
MASPTGTGVFMYDIAALVLTIFIIRQSLFLMEDVFE